MLFVTHFRFLDLSHNWHNTISHNSLRRTQLNECGEFPLDTRCNSIVLKRTIPIRLSSTTQHLLQRALHLLLQRHQVTQSGLQSLVLSLHPAHHPVRLLRLLRPVHAGSARGLVVLVAQHLVLPLHRTQAHVPLLVERRHDLLPWSSSASGLPAAAAPWARATALAAARRTRHVVVVGHRGAGGGGGGGQWGDGVETATVLHYDRLLLQLQTRVHLWGGKKRVRVLS